MAVEWIETINKMPSHGKKVLAAYKNSHGRVRVVIAVYFFGGGEQCACDHDCGCIYDEEMDESYYPAGWHEWVENWPEFAFFPVLDGVVKKWADLPFPDDC